MVNSSFVRSYKYSPAAPGLSTHTKATHRERFCVNSSTWPRRMAIIDKGDGVGNGETVDVGSAVKLPHATEFTELDGDGRRRWSESERECQLSIGPFRMSMP